MQDRCRVFEFAVFADRGGLAVALRLGAVDPEGCDRLLRQQLAEFLLRLNDEQGVAILLVDQSAALAFSLCERAYVLDTGRVALEGPSGDLARRTEVRSAYLGGPSRAPS